MDGSSSGIQDITYTVQTPYTNKVKKTTEMTDKEILHLCYEKHTQFEESPEIDEFFLDNPVLWPFCCESWEE